MIPPPITAATTISEPNHWIGLVGLALVLVGLVLAITRFRVHPFLALLVCSLLLGPIAGMPVADSLASFLDGFAGTMKWIGVVIVLGALIGEILKQTGGTLAIANTTLRMVGPKRLPLAMGLTGYLVSIPAYVDVAYIMLRPIVESLAAQSGRRVLVVGLSLTAGLTASHALLPPTPGPLATAAILNADLGRVISINAVVAAFALTGGLLWSTLYCSRVSVAFDLDHSETGDARDEDASAADDSKPAFIWAVMPILLPLALIAAGAFLKSENPSSIGLWFQFISSPVVALLCGMLAAACLLRGSDRMGQLGGFVEKAIESSAVVLLITAAGGGFGAVIKATGVGDDIAAMFTQAGLPPIILPFLLAAALTTATGSLTVAMVTTASVVAPMLGQLEISPELAVALIGAGSLCIIHANSSFFWLLSRLHSVPPSVLYRTYSLQSLCMALGGLTGASFLHVLGVT